MKVRLGVNGLSETRNTANIIGERAGQTDRVFMVGANLDSNFEARGINNNGSGAATLLEVATQIKERKLSTYNTIRIALWGASYSGEAGAYYYLDPDRAGHLTPDEKGKIVAYLNLDTLGSKNGVPFVYDGDGIPNAPIFGDPGAPGSDFIEAVLYKSFVKKGVPAASRPIEGLSDYVAFRDDGTIPFGAITSGFGPHGGQLADKTQTEAVKYGGIAGQPYDPCASLTCDTVKNISERMIRLMSGAAADAIVTLANNKTLLTRAPKPNLQICVCGDGTQIEMCAQVDCDSGPAQDTICGSVCATHGGEKATGCLFNDPICLIP